MRLIKTSGTLRKNKLGDRLIAFTDFLTRKQEKLIQTRAEVMSNSEKLMILLKSCEENLMLAESNRFFRPSPNLPIQNIKKLVLKTLLLDLGIFMKKRKKPMFLDIELKRQSLQDQNAHNVQKSARNALVMMFLLTLEKFVLEPWICILDLMADLCI